MPRPVLSITIPTYRQPEGLRRTLESLKAQITSEVEVFVRDDSPEDDSAKIVEEFQKEFPIRYERGEKGGLDRAIIFMTEEAKGDFVWWIGDDIIAPGGVARVLEVAKSDPELLFIFMNSRETTGEKGAYQLGGDDFFKNRDEVLSSLADGLGFITATILRRETAVSGLEASKVHIGSAWVCLYLVLHVLSNSGKYFYVATPYVISDPRVPNKPAWYDGFQVFAVNFYHVLMAFQGKFSRRALRHALSRNLAGIWRGILVYRAHNWTTGLGSPAPKIRPLMKLYWSYLEFWKAFPFLLLPRPVVGGLYRAFKATFR